MKTEIKVGDCVAYSAVFLRSIGCYTGTMPFLRGVVTKLTMFGGEDCTLAHIDWNSDEAPPKVHIRNLVNVTTSGIKEPV